MSILIVSHKTLILLKNINQLKLNIRINIKIINIDILKVILSSEFTGYGF